VFYSAEDRLIYVSPAGRKYDPLPVFRELVAQSLNQINVWITEWSDPDPLVRLRAEGHLAALARSVFGFEPFADGAGATDAEVLTTLDHYLRWQEGNG
jgi:hypothetical protein